MDLTLVPYQLQQHDQDGHHPHLHTSTSHKHYPNPISYVRYKECMKNHAASIGGHANDGCGEFMPSDDDDGGSNANLNLNCAACGCHRNFHRKEGTTASATVTSAACSVRQQSSHFGHLMFSPPPPTVGGKGATTLTKKHLITCDDHLDDVREDNDDHDGRSETPDRGEVNQAAVGAGGCRSKNKRFRTKFTQEQKDRMLEFAETIGWRINKGDDMALNQFCNEVGVKRNVLKVWMHNNKSVHRRRDVRQKPTEGGPPPPQAVGV